MTLDSIAENWVEEKLGVLELYKSSTEEWVIVLKEAGWPSRGMISARGATLKEATLTASRAIAKVDKKWTCAMCDPEEVYPDVDYCNYCAKEEVTFKH